jgi:hypothetical protein
MYKIFITKEVNYEREKKKKHLNLIIKKLNIY